MWSSPRHRGACPSGLRYGMQILNGQVVSAAGGAADVRGSVSPRRCGPRQRAVRWSIGQRVWPSRRRRWRWRLARPRQCRRLLGNLVGAADDVASGGYPDAANALFSLVRRVSGVRTTRPSTDGNGISVEGWGPYRFPLTAPAQYHSLLCVGAADLYFSIDDIDTSLQFRDGSNKV